MIRVLTPLALLGLLSACDGGGDPVQQALRDTSAANQAAAARTTEQMEAAGHAGHDMGGSTPGVTPGDRAFAASEAGGQNMDALTVERERVTAALTASSVMCTPWCCA